MSGQLAQTCIDLHVPVMEVCDGKDNDCDGVVDSLVCSCQSGRDCYLGAPYTNGVGVCRPGTFDCSKPLGSTCVGVDLGGVETCNGLDDDCNGAVDDNLPGTAPCAPGVCSSQFRACTNGVEAACTLSAIPGYQPSEACGDQLDNNCNGAVDEGCACDAGASQGCFTGPASACDGGACYGICRRGAQLCAPTSDGGLGFGSCGGQVLPLAEACADGLDNDCDNLVDCADPQCATRACATGAASAKTCFNSSCQCVFNGAVSTVEVCNDGVDNTCDSVVDCAQASCANQACGANGKQCVGTTCSCVVDGGTAEASEVSCGDSRDNDCDGLVDCQDSSCAGQTCGTGKRCSQNVCTCLVDGGVPQATEALCADGVDNDCDGLIDCADPNCAASCATAETNCLDNVDNDGDGKTDCADPDCQHKACASGSAASLCCGTVCRNLGNDPANCGQCGTTCTSGTCTPVTTQGKATGACSCAAGAACPMPDPGRTTQSCGANQLCTCGDDNDRCAVSQGGRCSITACTYP
jgi:hypothetical protein